MIRVFAHVVNNNSNIKKNRHTELAVSNPTSKTKIKNEHVLCKQTSHQHFWGLSKGECHQQIVRRKSSSSLRRQTKIILGATRCNEHATHRNSKLKGSKIKKPYCSQTSIIIRKHSQNTSQGVIHFSTSSQESTALSVNRSVKLIIFINIAVRNWKNSRHL